MPKPSPGLIRENLDNYKAVVSENFWQFAQKYGLLAAVDQAQDEATRLLLPPNPNEFDRFRARILLEQSGLGLRVIMNQNLPKETIQ